MASSKRPLLQLDRLKTLLDVVYALVIVQMFLNIPRPVQESWHWDSLEGYLAENGLIILFSTIGLIIAIIYWSQNNVLLGQLKHTDSWHTALAIFQVGFLFLFLYAIQLGIAFGGSPAGRAFESISVMLMGFAGSVSWNYARKNRRLIKDEVSDEAAIALNKRYLAEPLSAAFTLLFIFSPIIWEASWFAYPLFVGFVKWRRSRAKN